MHFAQNELSCLFSWPEAPNRAKKGKREDGKQARFCFVGFCPYIKAFGFSFPDQFILKCIEIAKRGNLFS